MIEFTPPIKKRETDELIVIAHGDTEDWQLEAIHQAKLELKHRNVSQAYQDRLLAEIEAEYQDYHRSIEKQHNLNATESYSLTTQIWIAVLSIMIVIGKREYELSLSELKADNYLLKYKQRMRALIIGLVTYFLIFYLSS